VIQEYLVKQFGIVSTDNDYRKVIAIIIALVTAIIIFSLSTVVNFFGNRLDLALLDGTIVILTLGVLYNFYRFKNIRLNAIIISAMVFASVVGSIILTKGDEYVLFYAFLYPISSMLLLGHKWALRSTLTLFVVLFVIANDYIGDTITLIEYLRFVTMSIVITWLLYFYERSTMSTLTLIQNNIDLNSELIISSQTDLVGRITQASDAFCAISGYSKEELIGQLHNIVRHPDMPHELFKQMWDDLSEQKSWRGEIKNRKKDGSAYWVKASIQPLYNQQGEHTGYTAIRQDITDKKLVEEISVTDSLTAVYNRRHFTEILPKIINSAKRRNELVSFLMVDIDYFKQYNDRYGHQMGDDALKRVAGALKGSLHRADDYCFRIGGEEFCVVFKVDRCEQAWVFSHTLKESVESLNIEHLGNEREKRVTISGGLVCRVATEIESLDRLYEEADKLLYQAKKEGRNQIASHIR
jgi:diguanylate cyclase (GGDEF)-like protein/PAS domain S-box-containing protein